MKRRSPLAYLTRGDRLYHRIYGGLRPRESTAQGYENLARDDLESTIDLTLAFKALASTLVCLVQDTVMGLHRANHMGVF